MVERGPEMVIEPVAEEMKCRIVLVQVMDAAANESRPESGRRVEESRARVPMEYVARGVAK